MALEDLPIGVYLPAGTYMGSHDSDFGMVVFCGGYACTDESGSFDNCATGQECYDFNTIEQTWKNNVPSLIRPRFAHYMDMMPEVIFML